MNEVSWLSACIPSGTRPVFYGGKAPGNAVLVAGADDGGGGREANHPHGSTAGSDAGTRFGLAVASSRDWSSPLAQPLIVDVHGAVRIYSDVTSLR